MPYKNPEDKHKWEREHREQRNATRRMQRLNARSRQQSVPEPAPDPVSYQIPRGKWGTILGLVVGIGVVLFAAIAGVNPSASAPRPRQA